MIGISSNNLDDVFLKKLNLPFTFNFTDDVDSIFIDWVPKIPMYEDAWMNQASLLQKYIKDVPVVIYDRHVSLTEKEVNWIKKFNTHLFEPVLNSGRSGFSYLPEWINDCKIIDKKEDREFDLVYSYPNIEYQIKEFEYWIKDYSRIFIDKKVAYSTFSITDFKKEEYKNNKLVYLENKHPIFNEGFFTVAIDDIDSYKMGYLNPVILNSLNLGCLPLLPEKHKYFHSMFKGLVISNIKEMDYYISLFKKVKDTVIEEIFEKIKNEWSEFTVDYASQKIRECYE